MMRQFYQSHIEPAYKPYMFDRGWRITKYVAIHLLMFVGKTFDWWIGKTLGALTFAFSRHWFIAYWIILSMAVFVFVGGFSCISTILVAAILLAIYVLILFSV